MQQLQQEWLALQQQSEDIEGRCLWLKVINVVICAWCLMYTFGAGIALVAIVYVLEAMYKTMQSRLLDRIVTIETALAENNPIDAFQLHRQWMQHRPGMLGLVCEYAKQCLRPTVAFPHLLLVILLLFVTFPLLHLWL
ncbi:hypothetical protein QX776_12985 [Alteromonadaceae bacterium BrNp21-10]|nr:hypothetical protein [Alteromonadaceae bacterium BrNp21-10]